MTRRSAVGAVMTRRGAGPLAIAVATMSLAVPLHAQSRISSSVDTTVMTVGDRVTLSVAVQHAADAVVSWPDSVDVAPFEVLGSRIAPVRKEGDGATSRASFTLTAFELGDLELPSLEVTVLHPDGREEVLSTDRFGVEVVSVGVDETGDIREIRGPLAIPLGIWKLLAWAVALLLLAAAAWVATRRFRASAPGEGKREAGPPPRPPHEVALEALAAVEASSLLAEGRVKEYHIRISEIVRRYVEERFGVRALEMTTWEILGGLQAAGVAEELRRDLRRFLDQCDLVKFAKAEPDDESSREALVLGRELVERSAPRPEPLPAAVRGPT